MDALSLLTKTQTDYVSNANLGVSEEIEVFYGDGTSKKSRGFAGSKERENENKTERYDDVIFSNVLLDKQPKYNDYITHNGEELLVSKSTFQNGLFTIWCKSNQSIKGRRR